MTVSEYLRAHEKIVLAVIAAGVLWFAIGRVDNILAKHDAANLKQAQIVATAQSDKNAAIAAQVASDNAAFNALQAKVQAQDAALIQANVALATALTKQQKTDAALPPTDLAARWNALVPNAGVSITNGQATLPAVGAIATVQQLEIIPVQQEEITNDQTLIANSDALAAIQTKEVIDLTAEVSGLKLQSVDDAKVCTERIKIVQDKARKSRWHWFWAGVASGFIGRQLIK